MSNSWSKLGAAKASFDTMLREFGVVTVMNARVYDIPKDAKFDGTQKAKDLLALYADKDSTDEKKQKLIATIKTLKVSNVTESGPSKTVTGGQYNNPLIKFGKTARLEMQDALGNADIIEALGGGVVEHYGTTYNAHGDKDANDVLHITQNFSGPVTIIGDSFFIDAATGEQVPVKIAFWKFLPDSLFNLTQDASGDATVFDLNGDLLTVDMLIGDNDPKEVADYASGVVRGVFYSIMPSTGESDFSGPAETDEKDPDSTTSGGTTSGE